MSLTYCISNNVHKRRTFIAGHNYLAILTDLQFKVWWISVKIGEWKTFVSLHIIKVKYSQQIFPMDRYSPTKTQFRKDVLIKRLRIFHVIRVLFFFFLLLALLFPRSWFLLKLFFFFNFFKNGLGNFVNSSKCIYYFQMPHV